MIEVKRYNAGFKQDWDNIINKSRIDTFLFYRDFMDYHSNRFEDSSFLIYRKGKLEALHNKLNTLSGRVYGNI